MKRLLHLALAALLLFAVALPALAAPVLEDGQYTVALTMEGGTGKAKIASPAKVEKRGDRLTAIVVWSSSHYDRMTVDGIDYFPVSLEEGATFEIPIVLDADMDVMAETVAMSTPHDIAYVLHFDSATLAPVQQGGNSRIAAAAAVTAAIVLLMGGVVFFLLGRRKAA